jgi:hypothetical protein
VQQSSGGHALEVFTSRKLTGGSKKDFLLGPASNPCKITKTFSSEHWGKVFS